MSSINSTASGAVRVKRVHVPTALTDNGANATTIIIIATTDLNISFFLFMNFPLDC
jgi:hypothetical protein